MSLLPLSSFLCFRKCMPFFPSFCCLLLLPCFSSAFHFSTSSSSIACRREWIPKKKHSLTQGILLPPETCLLHHPGLFSVFFFLTRFDSHSFLVFHSLQTHPGADMNEESRNKTNRGKGSNTSTEYEKERERESEHGWRNAAAATQIQKQRCKKRST